MFISNSKKNYYEKRNYDHDKISQNIRRNILRNLKKIRQYKKIIVFGVDLFSEKTCKLFKELEIEVFCFIDNNKYKRLSDYFYRKVYSLDEIKQMNCISDSCVIISAETNKEKKHDLLKLGFNKNQIFYAYKTNYFYNKDTLFYDLYIIIRSFYCYKKVINKYRNKQVLLWTYAGTGDAYLIGRVFEQFLNQNNIDNYVLLVGNNSFKKVLTHYKDFCVDVIPANEITLLSYFVARFGKKETGIIPLHFNGLIFQKTGRIWQNKFLNFKDLSYAQLGVYSHNIIDEKKIKFSEAIEKKSLDEINSYLSLNKKIIVLSPYAGSSIFSILSLSWWNNLSAELHKKGYFVLTNAFAKNEKTLNYSQRISYDYETMHYLLNRSYALVGIRSGLFDIEQDTICRKIILYPDYYSDCELFYFNLKNIFNVDNCYEFRVERDDNKLIQRILKEIEK